MKKSLLLIFLASIFLVGCASQSEVDDLESQISDLENTIDQCNSNIEDAQSYAGADYEDMEYALENLETCDY